MALRLHICMRESFSRSGGLHSYALSLAKGQELLGLEPAIIDNISATGQYGVAYGHLDVDRKEGENSYAHYHFAYGALPFVIPNRAPWKDLPRVYHFHGPWFMEGMVQKNSKIKTRLKRFIESSVYSKFSTFIVASDFFGKILSREFGIDMSRIHTVYPGVDTDRFSFASSTRNARELLGFDPDIATAVTVRRLEPRMGLEDAIQAISMIPDLHLIIAGDGSLRKDLESYRDSLGLESRVHFLGRVSNDQLPLVFQAGDFSIVPTRELEGFGIVVLESMSAGTPVIATNVGGLPEAMGPFATDWCVRPNSPDQLVKTIQAILTNSPSRLQVRAYAVSRSIRNMALEVESVLDTV